MVGKPLIVIQGATATGKTQLALQLAEALNGEIVGADSRQAYIGMDIGTAKPTREERARVRHHLVDVVQPDANLSVAEYQERAYAAIQALHEAGQVPFLVGGTGQYLSAVIEGWSIPRVPPNDALRRQLMAEAEAQGNAAFHARLAEIDPAAAETIHPNNVRRVVRALEVYLETGQPISDLQRKQPPPYRIRTLGLTMPREVLYARADARIDAMIAAGFVDEVRRLLSDGYGRDLPAMSAVGYPEMAAHLLDDLPLEAAVQKIKSSTHDFIRRQDVWFRGHDHGAVWYDGASLDTSALIEDLADWLHAVENGSFEE